MNVFISRPTWVSPEFDEGLSTFLTLIDNLGLSPRTLGSTDYPSKAPLDEVIEIMKDCRGAVILGYPQIYVHQGILKKSEINQPLLLATEWNHLEAGLAYAQNIPLLVIHHLGISRGIFDRGVMNAYIHAIDLTLPNWPMSTTINGAINKWKTHCLNKHESEKDTWPSSNKVTSPQTLEDVQEKILQVLVNGDSHTESIAKTLGINIQLAQYHLEELESVDFIHRSLSITGQRFPWQISHEGRRYLVMNHLLN